jgi:low affinity Fe/Cu permease
LEAVQTEDRLHLNIFDRIAKRIAHLMGHPAVFAMACLVIVVWAALGPVLGYSDSWQLVINTSTTIVTFLMVFLIQNTQNRDSEALHLKIDELLRALDAADTRLVDLEERSEQELEQLRKKYMDLASHPALEDQIKADDPAQSASDTRAGQRPRNQSLRPRVQDPQT